MEEGIGAFIRRQREALGLTQRELAERMGIDRSIISQIERSATRWPQKHLEALARELNVSEVELAVAAGKVGPEALMSKTTSRIAYRTHHPTTIEIVEESDDGTPLWSYRVTLDLAEDEYQAVSQAMWAIQRAHEEDWSEDKLFSRLTHQLADRSAIPDERVEEIAQLMIDAIEE